MVRVVADSLNTGTSGRFSTVLIENFPKCLLAELNTHRQLVRNTASSRAMPGAKMRDIVDSNTYVPTWTGNQPGMSGNESADLDRQALEYEWFMHIEDALRTHQALLDEGAHKQEANRLLDSFVRIPVLLSGTDWDNFLTLRTALSTTPDFREIACEIRDALAASVPKQVDALKPFFNWHIPFESDIDPDLGLEDKLKVSVAKCARISYHNMKSADIHKDLELFDRLLESKHLSCFEHISMAAPVGRFGLAEYTYDSYEDCEDCNVEPLPNGLTNYFSYVTALSGISEYVWTRQYRNWYTLRHAIEDGLYS